MVETFIVKGTLCVCVGKWSVYWKHAEQTAMRNQLKTHREEKRRLQFLVFVCLLHYTGIFSVCVCKREREFCLHFPLQSKSSYFRFTSALKSLNVFPF